MLVNQCFYFFRNFPGVEPVYAQVDRRSKKHASSSDEVFTHRRYLSAGANVESAVSESVNPLSTSPSHPPPTADIHSLATLPSHARREYLHFSVLLPTVMHSSACSGIKLSLTSPKGLTKYPRTLITQNLIQAESKYCNFI